MPIQLKSIKFPKMPLAHCDRVFVLTFFVWLTFFATALWLIQDDHRANPQNGASQKQHARSGQEGDPATKAVRPPQRNPHPERNEWREEEDLRAQRDMSRWAFWSLIASWVATVGSGIGIFLVWQTLRQNRGATEAANAAVGIAQQSLEETRKTTQITQKQLIAAQRPWLKVQIVIDSPLVHADDGTVSLSILFIVQNIGNYPAKDVWLNPKMSIPAFNAPEMMSNIHLASVVQETRESGDRFSSFGHFIFPGDPISMRWIFKIGKDEIKAATQMVQFATPVLAGSISYRFDTSEEMHQTAFVRHICRTDRDRPEAKAANRAQDAIFMDEGNIAKEDLTFRPAFTTSDYAD